MIRLHQYAAVQIHLVQSPFVVAGPHIYRFYGIGDHIGVKTEVHGIQCRGLDAIIGGQSADVEGADLILLKEAGQRDGSFKSGITVIDVVRKFS